MAHKGQGINTSKERLILPILTDKILKTRSQIETPLSILDMGSGDTSFIQALIILLARSGTMTNRLVLVDQDPQWPIPEDIVKAPFDVDLIKTTDPHTYTNFLEDNKSFLDLATFQLIFHQIENIHLLSFLLFFAINTLIDKGDIYITNLHPDYLDFLKKHFPQKYSDSIYRHDSGGETRVHERSLIEYMSTLISMGINPVSIRDLYTHTIVDSKPIYKKLSDKNIPLFYLMHAQKNPNSILSTAWGQVRSSQPGKNNWYKVTFKDGKTLTIPGTSIIRSLKKDEVLFLLETYIKKAKSQYLHYWVINKLGDVGGGVARVDVK